MISEIIIKFRRVPALNFIGSLIYDTHGHILHVVFGLISYFTNYVHILYFDHVRQLISASTREDITNQYEI